MKRILSCLFYLVLVVAWFFAMFALPIAAHAQLSDNSVYVKQFPGNDVGTKTAAAQAACNPDTSLPCLVVFDSSLAKFAQGTLPAKCTQCIWVDFRTGTGLANPGGMPGQPQQNSNGLFAGKPNTYIAGSGFTTQQCINAAIASGSGDCQLPAGYAEMITSPVTIAGNVNLECGNGATLTSAGVNIFQISGAYTVKISGCTLDGNNTANSSAIIASGFTELDIVNHNTIRNFTSISGVIQLSALWQKLDISNNFFSNNNAGDTIYATHNDPVNGSARVSGNVIYSESTTYHHIIAFHGSDNADAATVTAACTIQSATITSLTISGGVATVTTSGTLPANFATATTVNITGSTGGTQDGYYTSITVTGANTLTFPTSKSGSSSAGTISTGTVTSATVTAAGNNYPATGNLLFFNGQVGAGGITTDFPTGTWTAPANGPITGATITHGGYCNSNPAVHVTNNDSVQHVDVGGNYLFGGDDYGVEVGAFGGVAGADVKIHHNHYFQAVNVAGYGAYSVDTVSDADISNNWAETTQPIGPTSLLGIECVNVPNCTVEGNTLIGFAISLNKSWQSIAANNVVTGLYSGAVGIYNGTSDNVENVNHDNTITGNFVAFQPGATSGTGIQTQCNAIASNCDNAKVTGNNVQAASGQTGNGITVSVNGLGAHVNNYTQSGNTIVNWATAYNINAAATGSIFYDALVNVGSVGTTNNFSVLNTFPNQGSATLAAGTKTVTNANVTSSSIITLSNCGVGGTAGILSLGTVTPGTSFVINSSNAADTSKVCWRF